MEEKSREARTNLRVLGSHLGPEMRDKAEGCRAGHGMGGEVRDHGEQSP